jgi:hypothetical protein
MNMNARRAYARVVARYARTDSSRSRFARHGTAIFWCTEHARGWSSPRSSSVLGKGAHVGEAEHARSSRVRARPRPLRPH